MKGESCFTSKDFYIYGAVGDNVFGRDADFSIICSCSAAGIIIGKVFYKYVF